MKSIVLIACVLLVSSQLVCGKYFNSPVTVTKSSRSIDKVLAVRGGAHIGDLITATNVVKANGWTAIGSAVVAIAFPDLFTKFFGIAGSKDLTFVVQLFGIVLAAFGSLQTAVLNIGQSGVGLWAAISLYYFYAAKKGVISAKHKYYPIALGTSLVFLGLFIFTFYV